METKTLLRLFILIIIVSAGMFILSASRSLPIATVGLKSEILEDKGLIQTSINDYIFFRSITRFFVTSLSK